MSSDRQVEELEAALPWLRDDFRAGLAALDRSTARAAVQYAADVRVLAGLIALVPRASGDDTGATAWTSFRREVAVARHVSDQAAAGEIRAAERLTTVLPTTMQLLETGRITVSRARRLVDELEHYDDEIAVRLDADLAEQVSGLPAWRIAERVRRAATALDTEAAARHTARATAGRRVALRQEQDEQASVFLTGPAVPLTRWYGSLDEQARALKQAGDARTLDALRFDLATSTLPCSAHPPADPTTPPAVVTSAPAGLRPSGVEAAPTDCRRGRPVQAVVVVPVETALGLSNEPGWLDGYGWVGAPTSRQLLVDAELRVACARSGTGELVDVADRVLRPPPTPEGVRTALTEVVLGDLALSDVSTRVEGEHDPSDTLRRFVELRDRTCDGPTGSRTSARRCDLDHDTPYPHGPTAAWNLVARSRRTHALKHLGWTPVRTPTSTLWTSPAGQLVEVPRRVDPPPGVDAGDLAALPDAGLLDEVDRQALAAPTDDDLPPWLPASERAAPVAWTWLDGSDVPF